MFICSFCSKECKNHNSHRNHERLCKSNPNYQLTWLEKNCSKLDFYNDPSYREKQRLNSLGKKHSKKTKEKLSSHMKNLYSNPQNRKNQSRIMKEVVRKNPDSYSKNNVCGRNKKLMIDGVRYHSTWEYEVACYLSKNNIDWTRDIDPISYWWNDGWHLYFPDFYLPNFDIFIEVKGYQTKRDIAKWKHTTKPLLILKEKELAAIRNQSYDILMEAKAKSGAHLLITG